MKTSIMKWGEFADLAFKHLGNKVMTGLFAGMELSRTVAWDDGNHATKLVGTYESELHPAISKAIARQPKVIGNIGCAEGYYAVGLGRLLPKSRILAFDKSLEALKCCHEMVKRNGLDNVSLWLVDDPELYVNYWMLLFAQLDLLVVDCEGDELSYFVKDIIPSLSRCDVIVECHDFMFTEGEEKRQIVISDMLSERFIATHEVEKIEIQRSKPSDYPFLSFLRDESRHYAVYTFHPEPTVWLACWSKTR